MKVTFFSGTTSTSIVAGPQVIAVGLVDAEKTQLLSEINDQAAILIDAAASTAAAAAAPAAADAIRAQVAADADRAEGAAETAAVDAAAAVAPAAADAIRAEVATQADRAEAARDDASAVAGIREFRDVPTLLANATLAYGPGAAQVQAGDIVRMRAEGTSYRVASADAATHDLATAGGVRVTRVHHPFISPRDFGAAGDRSKDDSDAVQKAMDFASASKGTEVVLDGHFRLSKTLTSSGLLTLRGFSSSGNNNTTDKGALSWDTAPDGLDAGLRITGQNWSITNVSFKGGNRVNKILRLEAASVGFLQFCNISTPKSNDRNNPGSCIWGYGLIGVRIMDNWISHPNYSRGIHVEEANKPSGHGAYYGFDNGSAVLRNRIYGNMANCIFDGGTFEFSGNDCEGGLLIDTGKVIIPGTSTLLVASTNYAELTNTGGVDTNPDKQPMIWFQNKGTGHQFVLSGNRGYTMPTKEPGSICFDLGGSGGVGAYYESAVLLGNFVGRFESAFALRGRTGSGYTELTGTTVGTIKQMFADKSYVKLTSTVSNPSPCRITTSLSSAPSNLEMPTPVERREGLTESNAWVNQTAASLNMFMGNNIFYGGASGAELTYSDVPAGYAATAGSLPAYLCGSTWRIHNRSGGDITLRGGNGLSGTFFRAGAGVISLAQDQMAVVTMTATRKIIVESIVG